MSGRDYFQPPDGLGVHSVQRYRHFRRFVEAQGGELLDQTLFGLLLSAESMRDEMRAYEEQSSRLVRLAQTGHFVRQLQRLNRILDEASVSYGVEESGELRDWKGAMESEREDRVGLYDRALSMMEGQGECHPAQDETTETFFGELETEEQQEEVLTLLKAAIDTYSDDVLTPHESQTIAQAFLLVAEFSSVCVVSLPTWFAPEFEFASTFGLSRWGNDLHVFPDSSDTTMFIQTAEQWSKLNHPHVAKFLGASHVGQRRVIAHEKLRPLVECLSDVKDNKVVWRRVHELTLCLQYLHERGLSCEGLSIDRLYCVQYEAKLVLLGTDIRDVGARELAPNHLQADLLALKDIIGTVLRKVSSGPSPAGESVSNAIPIVFFSKPEWALIQHLGRKDPDPARTLLLAMDQIKGLAGGDQQIRGFDDLHPDAWEHATVNGHVDIGQITASNFDNAPVSTILSICQEWTSDDDLSRPVCARLEFVLEQLCQQVDHQPEEQTFKEVVAHFVRLLGRFYEHLKGKISSSLSSGFCAHTFASASSDAGMDEPGKLLRLHIDIDRFLLQHGFDDRSAPIHSWEPQFRELWPDARSVSLEVHRRVVSASGRLDLDKSMNQDPNCGPRLLAGPISEHPASSNLEAKRLADDVHHLLSFRWFVSPSEVDFQSYPDLGSGSFGSVYSGWWFHTPVVVKRVKPALHESRNEADSRLSQFRNEADIWFRLNHINVVKMYGACDFGDPFFVCELASGGDLKKYLNKRGRPEYLIWYSLLNAALGLQYLHDNGIVHGDLKANNILVGADDVVKLADFGLSRSMGDGRSSTTEGAQGAFRWKAPEHIDGEPATFAADVYSFAMVMIEVVTGEVPWVRFRDGVVRNVVTSGRDYKQPSSIKDAEWRLIQRMCCFDPAKRVTIDTVVVYLTSLVDGMDRTTWVDQAEGRRSTYSHKNRVQARGGALMALLSLASSDNERLSSLAADHLAAVHINRETPSEQREINAIVKLLAVGGDAEKTWAADVLWRLVLYNPANKKLVAEAGAIEHLVKLLRDGNGWQMFHAASALFNLASDKNNKTLIAEAGAIPPLIALLKFSNEEFKTKAAGVLRNLAVDWNNKTRIGRGDAIPHLVAMVRDGVGREKEQAAATLSNLAQLEANHPLIIDADGIKPLVQLVRRGNEAEKERATGALMFLSRSANSISPIADAGGIEPLVALLHSGSPVTKDAAACTLQSLSVDRGAVPRIVSAKGIPPLVSLVQHGSDIQRTNVIMTLSRLAVCSARNQSLIAGAGGVPALVAAVRDGASQEKLFSAIALRNLVEDNERNQTLVADAGGVRPLVALVRRGNADQTTRAAAALARLAWNNLRIQKLVADAGGVPPLVDLVRDGNSNQVLEAAAALSVLAMHPLNKLHIIDSGGVAPLISLMLDGGPDPRPAVVVALYMLRSGVPTRDCIFPVTALIPVLIKNVARGTYDQQLRAADLLVFLAHDLDTQACFTAEGGFDALFAFIERAGDDGKVKGLLALEKFCRNVGVIARTNLMAVRGVALLSQLARSRRRQLRELAGLVLAELEIARNPDRYPGL